MSLKLVAIFALTEFLLSLTPGPAVLLVIAQSLRNGFRSSISGALGILTGNAIYFVLSALGLGALLATSAMLFQIIKWAGVVYLMVTGLRMLLGRSVALSPPTQSDATTLATREDNGDNARLFLAGLVTQLSNPKAIVFFTALLPQFISPMGHVAGQFVTLGIVSLAVEFPVLLLYGLAAAESNRLLFRGNFSSLPDRIAGGFLVGAGLTLAATRRM